MSESVIFCILEVDGGIYFLNVRCCLLYLIELIIVLYLWYGYLEKVIGLQCVC